MIMPNAPAAQISLHLGAKGWLEAPVSACSGGSEAIARAVSLLRDGIVDVVVTGGAEAIVNQFGLAAFGAMQALAGSDQSATADRSPAELSRPFDAERSGFVMGEGAGVLVLERLTDAKRRRAKIHGVLRGVGCTADAHDIVSPRPDGAQALEAMRRSLADAGLSVADLDLIKAHATGTRAGDAAEARALAGLVGNLPEKSRPWLMAPKAVLGHLISASGPVELLLVLEALNRGQLPAQANCPNPDPVIPCRLPRSVTTLSSPRSGHAYTALANSFGFGGRNISLVLDSQELDQ
jgi:3-oxoacyl-[acyl-carrier-protein] synthase II